MESDIHWPLQSTLLLFSKGGYNMTTLIMVMISASVIVVFADKGDSHNNSDSQ
jgi:hypothetical protein